MKKQPPIIAFRADEDIRDIVLKEVSRLLRLTPGVSVSTSDAVRSLLLRGELGEAND